MFALSPFYSRPKHQLVLSAMLLVLFSAGQVFAASTSQYTQTLDATDIKAVETVADANNEGPPVQLHPEAAPTDHTPEPLSLLDDEVPAVGAISGPLGLCTGTLIDPQYIVTTKSCVLAVTHPHRAIDERLSQLYFIAPTEKAKGRPPVQIIGLQADDHQALYALQRECLSRRHMTRPSDALVLLQLAKPLDDIKPIDVSASVSTALYNRPEVVTVGYGLLQPVGENFDFGPRLWRPERIGGQTQRALVGKNRSGPVGIADLGSPLITCDNGRWLLLGALAGSYYRDDDAPWLSAWGHVNFGRHISFSRYLRCDAATNLWRVQHIQDLRMPHQELETSIRWPSLPRRFPHEPRNPRGFVPSTPTTGVAAQPSDAHVDAATPHS